MNLPPLKRRRAAPTDALPAGQRRAVVATILALHGLAGWAVLQVPAVREALNEAAPIFVKLIAPEAPPKPPELPPPPHVEPPRPVAKLPPPPAPLITAAPLPLPAPADFVAPAPPDLPPVAEAPTPPAVVAVQAPPAPPPPTPPPPAPKTIPASAVQYLVAPVVEYPRLSRRANEQGRVMVRVYIDEAGLPRSVLVSQSSGHVRLDEAAIAAVQKARFKPYTENGQPTAGWAYTPIDFDLEK